MVFQLNVKSETIAGILDKAYPWIIAGSVFILWHLADNNFEVEKATKVFFTHLLNASRRLSDPKACLLYTIDIYLHLSLLKERRSSLIRLVAVVIQSIQAEFIQFTGDQKTESDQAGASGSFRYNKCMLMFLSLTVLVTPYL